MAAVDALAAGVLARHLRPTPSDFVANPQVDPVLERGRYLVEGLGHCGACHTPRSLTMQEKALSESEGDDYLAGSNAPIDGWVASSLRGENRDGLGPGAKPSWPSSSKPDATINPWSSAA